MLRISFTGHRPNKLGGYDWNSPKNKCVRNILYNKIIDTMITSNETDFMFITGGALGIDQFAFDVINNIKAEINPNKCTIQNIIAVPFKDQPNAWFNKNDISRYNEQLKQADRVIYVDTLDEYKRSNTPEGKYNAQKLQIRNAYMVDNCDILIAVWDGSNSGTGNCVYYAKHKGVKIIQINPKEVK